MSNYCNTGRNHECRYCKKIVANQYGGVVVNTKQKLILAYCIIAILFGTYGWLFGQFKYHSFFYNMGRGIVWPVTVFPELGVIVGGIIIVAFVLLVTRPEIG